MDNYPRGDKQVPSAMEYGDDTISTIEKAEHFRTQLGGDCVDAHHYLMALIENEAEFAQYIAEFVNQAINDSELDQMN